MICHFQFGLFSMNKEDAIRSLQKMNCFMH